MSTIVSSPRTRAVLALVTACVLAAGGCSSRRSDPATEPPAPPPSQPTKDAGASLTAEQCKAAGGEVIGDIGDGAIHRPDYRCARSGQPPLGHIAAEPGQPIAVEGAVCCR